MSEKPSRRMFAAAWRSCGNVGRLPACGPGTHRPGGLDGPAASRFELRLRHAQAGHRLGPVFTPPRRVGQGLHDMLAFGWQVPALL